MHARQRKKEERRRVDGFTRVKSPRPHRDPEWSLVSVIQPLRARSHARSRWVRGTALVVDRWLDGSLLLFPIAAKYLERTTAGGSSRILLTRPALLSFLSLLLGEPWESRALGEKVLRLTRANASNGEVESRGGISNAHRRPPVCVHVSVCRSKTLFFVRRSPNSV